MNPLEKYIRNIKDFPKKGIDFKDITTLLQDPEGLQKCFIELKSVIGDEKIDKVVGMESRGFFFVATHRRLQRFGYFGFQFKNKYRQCFFAAFSVCYPFSKSR